MTLKVASAERPRPVLRVGTGNHPGRPNIGQPEHYDYHGNIQSVGLESSPSMGESRLSLPQTSPRRRYAGSTTWVPLPVVSPGIQYADLAGNPGAFLSLGVESYTPETSEMLALQQATMDAWFSTEHTADIAPGLGMMKQDAVVSSSKIQDKPKARLQALPGSHHQVPEIARQKWKPTKMNAARRGIVESALETPTRRNREGSRVAPLLDEVRGLSHSAAHKRIGNDKNVKGYMAEQQPKPKEKKPGNHTGLSKKYMSNMQSGSSIPSIPLALLTKEQLESQCLELSVEALGLKMQLLEKTTMELTSQNAVLKAHVSELRKNLLTQDWMIKGKRRKHEMVHNATKQHQLLRESKRKQAKKAKEAKSSKEYQKEIIVITGKDTASIMLFYTVVFMAIGIIMFPIAMLFMRFTK